MNIILGNLIGILHGIFVFLMMFGFVLPGSLLKYYLLLWPLTWLHWQINDDKCILTELEYKLKGKTEIPKSKSDHNYPFMRKLYSMFNINLTDNEIHMFIITKINILWLFGALRFLKYIQSK